MKIAMMVRGYIPAPRPADIIYAPIDLAVALAQGLAERGHQIDFFGPQGTHIPGATIVSLNLRPLVHDQKEFGELVLDAEKQMHYVPGLWDRKLSNEMFRRAKTGKYDLLHFHHPEIAIPSAIDNPTTPIVYTLHDPIYPWYRELFDLYESPNQHFVSVSDNQRRDAPDLAYAATIYNGIDPKLFKFSAEHEDYLLFAGRIVPEKGIKEAIKIAQASDRRLLIIGPVYDKHKEYFNQYIKPHLNDKILYLGFMEQEQLVKYYQKALALLMPIQWEEPFGLTMTEAMACGTPVIGLRRGSVPELVVNGKTGFVCDHIQEMIEAVEKVGNISRKACRSHVQGNFTYKQMVDAYETAFKNVVGQRTSAQTPGKLIGKKLTSFPRKLKNRLKI